MYSLEAKHHQIQKTILVVLAHPDDESFPIGGSLAKYARLGHRLILVSATKGEAGIPGKSKRETAIIREKELLAAARLLGIERVIFLGYHDGEVARVPAHEITQKLVDILHSYQPEIVISFGPDGISGHDDHIATSHWVTRAVDRAGLPTRLFYIMPSEATFQGCGEPPTATQHPGAIAAVDIGKHLVTKVKAMQAHKSQNPPFSGEPEEEASKLVCHEYFSLARPAISDGLYEDLLDPRISTIGQPAWGTNMTTQSANA